MTLRHLNLLVKQTMYKKTLLVTSLVISLGLSGCVIHVNDTSGVSSLMGDVSVSAHKSVGDVSSVNGDIELQEYVTARNVDSVNGDIELSNDVSVSDINVVNGDIVAEARLNVSNNIESVNGDVDLNEGSRVEGAIESVNGDISLSGTNVGQHVITKNGDIALHQDSYVGGNIVFEKQRNNNRHVPTLIIRQGSTVEGDIILYREVKLELDDPSLQSKVVNRWAE